MICESTSFTVQKCENHQIILFHSNNKLIYCWHQNEWNIRVCEGHIQLSWSYCLFNSDLWLTEMPFFVKCLNLNWELRVAIWALTGTEFPKEKRKHSENCVEFDDGNKFRKLITTNTLQSNISIDQDNFDNVWLDLNWIDLTWIDLNWIDLNWLDFQSLTQCQKTIEICSDVNIVKQISKNSKHPSLASEHLREFSKWLIIQRLNKEITVSPL
jgi:hypothetical protein